MSAWTTKATDRDGEFIILKHGVRGINYNVKGIRFRDGFAVVQKNSKTYHNLKKIPNLQNAQEYHLLHLRNLPFITRSSDIQQIYGKDVYHRYLKMLEISKTEEYQQQQILEEKITEEVETKHIEEGFKCQYRLSNKKLCQHDAEQLSPSKYCRIHLLDDRKLIDFGIKIPLAVPKHLKNKLRQKVLSQLKKLLKEDVEVKTNG
jgi:hypothetical protein